ncbi:MAG: alpha/beta hydrolase [Alphaproteobacteria bacterium]|nr:alpha/beta hydrolase [Alphaproteobacteria bacterium]
MATYLLIHGAYQGGWIWKPTAARLRRAGHLVYAPSLDGCADRRHALRPGINVETHAAEIAELLFYEDLKDVVLTGTSAGGMILCRAAELARERIGRLVFVDALALFDGERIEQIVSRRTPRVMTALSVGPSREDAENRSFADLDSTTRALALARYTPHPIAAMEEPVSLKSFWSQPWRATVIRCRRAANPGEAHQRRTADKLGAKYLEIDTGHYPMLSDPDVLAPLLMQE